MMPINGGNSAMNDGAIASDDKLHKYLYHGTPPKNKEEIEKHGFKPNKADVEEGSNHSHVYLTTEPGAAREYGGMKSGYKKNPHIFAIHRDHPSIKGSVEVDPEGGEKSVQTTLFRTKNHIPKEAISHSFRGNARNTEREDSKVENHLQKRYDKNRNSSSSSEGSHSSEE